MKRVQLIKHLKKYGKQHIYAHHLTVPYRPLETDESRSCNPTEEDDNLIIQGDNLTTPQGISLSFGSGQ